MQPPLFCVAQPGTLGPLFLNWEWASALCGLELQTNDIKFEVSISTGAVSFSEAFISYLAFFNHRAKLMARVRYISPCDADFVRAQKSYHKPSNQFWVQIPNYLFFKNKWCLYVCLCWVFIAVCELSLVVVSESYSSWDAQASQCGYLLQRMGSSHTGFRSFPKTCGIFLDQGSNLSPAWAGRYLTTWPPGKSPTTSFNWHTKPIFLPPQITQATREPTHIIQSPPTAFKLASLKPLPLPTFPFPWKTQ